jgi:enoyl-CoA hydratase/carnithine racemase
MTFLDQYNPKQLTLTAESPTFWRVTFDNPPVNVIGPDMVRDLKVLLTELEHNDTVNVVLFDSADPDFYLAHYDLAADPAIAEALPSPTGYPAWTDITVRLSKLSAVTISAIRGIARGAGSEFTLATDIRFASREKAILGQFEVGFTAVPGGGAGGRLPALVGRGRTFEILLGGEDFDGTLAEKYGYVNRAIADSEFVAFVDAYATRVSKWDHRALSEIKSFINKYTRLPDGEFPLHTDAFWRAAARPEFQATTAAALDNGLQQRSPLEYHLGEEISKIAAASGELCGLISQRRLDREVAPARDKRLSKSLVPQRPSPCPQPRTCWSTSTC